MSREINRDFTNEYYLHPYRSSLQTTIVATQAMRDLVAFLPDSSLNRWQQHEDLDRTLAISTQEVIFYPEGGGQPGDTGIICSDNQEITIIDTQVAAGRVWHLTICPDVQTLKNLGDDLIAQTVICKLDFQRRFDLMQHHTAEHILSGLAFQKYATRNIGFHLTTTEMSIDFDQVLTSKQLLALETAANEVICRNLALETEIFDPNIQTKDNFRSKKNFDCLTRLVKIGTFDLCACCGVHVETTGEVGLIKILRAENKRAGITIAVAAGRRALTDYQKKHDLLVALSQKYSLKPLVIHLAMTRYEDEIIDLKASLTDLKKEFWQLKIADWQQEAGISSNGDSKMLLSKLNSLTDPKARGQQLALVFTPAATCSLKDIKTLTKAYLEAGAESLACFINTNVNNYQYFITTTLPNINLQALQAELAGRFKVKGGGRFDLIQGRIEATRTEITTLVQAWFENCNLA